MLPPPPKAATDATPRGGKEEEEEEGRRRRRGGGVGGGGGGGGGAYDAPWDPRQPPHQPLTLPSSSLLSSYTIPALINDSRDRHLWPQLQARAGALGILSFALFLPFLSLSLSVFPFSRIFFCVLSRSSFSNICVATALTRWRSTSWFFLGDQSVGKVGPLCASVFDSLLWPLL